MDLRSWKLPRLSLPFKWRKRQDPLFFLGEPTANLPETGTLSELCFFTAVLMLAGAACLGCFCTAFEISLSLLPVITLGSVLALLCTLRFFAGRWKWPMSLGMWGVWLLLVGSNWKNLLLGFSAVSNAAIRVYSDKLGVSLPIFLVSKLFPDGLAFAISDPVTLFAVFFLFPLLWVFSWLLTGRRSLLPLFCLTGLFLLAPLVISVLPAAWALGAMLLLWSFLLLASPSLHRRHSIARERNRFQVSGGVFASPITLTLLPILALCMVLLYTFSPPETYQRPKTVNRLRSTLSDGVNIPAMLRGGTGSGNNEIDLTTLGQRTYSGETALRVRLRFSGGTMLGDDRTYSAQKEYLKSFVGSVYTGTRWERLSESDRNEVRDILGERDSMTFPYAFQHTIPSENLDLMADYMLAVDKVDVDPRCIFVPYGMHTLSVDGDWEPDGYVRSQSLFSGPAGYTIDGCAVPLYGFPLYDRAILYQAEKTPFVLNVNEDDDLLQMQVSESSIMKLLGDAVTLANSGGASSGNVTVTTVKGSTGSSSGSLTFQVQQGSQHNGAITWNISTPSGETAWDAAREQLEADLSTVSAQLNDLYGDYADRQNAAGGSLNPDLWTMPDWAKKQLLETQPNWKLAEAAEDYSRFVYEHYTQLPDETREFALQYLQDHHLNPPDLGDPTPYLSADREESYCVPWMTERISTFAKGVRGLLESECDYTLRPASPPKDEDFVKFFLTESRQGYCVHYATAAVVLLRAAGIPARYAEGYVAPTGYGGHWVDVPDSNSHAWVELYWGGLGWVPFEVTPAVPGAPAAYDAGMEPVAAVGGGQAPQEPDPMEEPTPRPHDYTATYTPPPAELPEEPAVEEPANIAIGPDGAILPAEPAPKEPWVPTTLEKVLLSMGGAVLLLMLIPLSRWVRIGVRTLQFRQKDRNKAALRVYAYLLRLYRASYVLPQGSLDPPEEVTELAWRARYSHHTLDQADIQQLLDRAKVLQDKMKKELAPKVRWRYKYLLALF